MGTKELGRFAQSFQADTLPGKLTALGEALTKAIEKADFTRLIAAVQVLINLLGKPEVLRKFELAMKAIAFVGSGLAIVLGLVSWAALEVFAAVGWVVDRIEQLQRVFEGGSTAGEFVYDLLEPFASIGETFVNIGKAIIEGLWEGMKAAWNVIAKPFKDMVDGIPKSFSSMMRIRSPSRVMYDLGKWVPLGLAKGIESESATVSMSVTRVARNAAEAVQAPREIVMPRGAAPATPSAGGGGARVTVNAPVEISMSPAGGQSPQAAADEFLRHFARSWDWVATEMGAL
jgi:hypothetical protein